MKTVVPQTLRKLRRTAVLSAGVAAFVFGACPAHADTTLYVGAYGGSFEQMLKKDIIPGFEKANPGTKVVIVPGDSTTTLAKLQAQKGKAGMDVVFLDDGPMYQAIQMGFCGKLADAPIYHDLYDIAKFKSGNAVAAGLIATGIAYNTKVISPEEAKEKGAALLLDKKYAGKVGGYSDMTTRVWYAALATGQDPNNIKDMDTIWAKVRETRDLAKKFWSSGAELMDLLSKGEIVVTDAWSGRVAALQDQGHPIGYLDPAGSYAWMEDMLILKGSPMAESEELINFMLDPATSIAVAEGQSYPPSLDPTKVKLTEKIEKLPAFDKTGTMKSLTFADPTYWANNEDAWTKQWNRISKGA